MNFILYGIRGNTWVLVWSDDCKYTVMIYISEHVFWWDWLELNVPEEEIMG